MLKTFAAVFVSVLSLSTPVLAQGQVSTEVPQTALTREDKTESSAGIATRLTVARSQSAVQVAPVFSIEGSTDNKIASGQIGFQFTNLTLTLGAQSPLGGSAKSATLADLDGLRSKATGKFEFLWSHWNNNFEQYAQAFAKACSDNSDETITDCTYLRLKRDRTKAGQKRFRDLRRTVNPGTVFLAGANAQIAPEDFSYLNETNLSEAKVRHVSWSAGGMGGVLFPNSIMVAVNYKRQVVYTANDETQVCSPIGLLSSLNCSQQILGPPADPKRSNQTGIEVRKIFNQYFAISPRLTRDWTHQSTGVELPLFFFRDSAGGLNGGVSLGWRSDTKSFTASAFIGQVLGVIAK